MGAKKKQQNIRRTKGGDRSARSSTPSFQRLTEIDGRHPLQKAVPESAVMYPVRELQTGRVFYFNFDLARDMGLIDANHPNSLTTELEKQLIQAFSLRIINEHDYLSNKKFRSETIKHHRYMATRYLQMQHPNKQGKTSGDGRSIWNGYWLSNKIWDISSRGTGVTRLSPGVVLSAEFLETGSVDTSYGCGTADIDELFGTAIMAEIFHFEGIPTERVLAVIDLGDGVGIGVRAGPNLLRPAHFFMYLKQNRHEPAAQMVDYFIQRQKMNGDWVPTSRGDRYKQFMNFVSDRFAKFVALLESEYIFAWLDWDGDNVLATAGIIDYGSIRQFGLRHDQYRFDDVERFSTNLNEQKQKARLTVQVFAQLIDFVKTRKKKPLRNFRSHSSVKQFDRLFEKYYRQLLLKRLGLSKEVAAFLDKYHRKNLDLLLQHILFFERKKTKKGITQVQDGVNRPAIYNVRNLLYHLAVEPSILVSTDTERYSVKCLHKALLAKDTRGADAKLYPALKKRIANFKKNYSSLCQTIERKFGATELAATLSRTRKKCRPQRITGNGMEYVIERLVEEWKQTSNFEHITQITDAFIQSQTGTRGPLRLISRDQSDLLQELLAMIAECQEDI